MFPAASAPRLRTRSLLLLVAALALLPFAYGAGSLRPAVAGAASDDRVIIHVRPTLSAAAIAAAAQNSRVAHGALEINQIKELGVRVWKVNPGAARQVIQALVQEPWVASANVDPPVHATIVPNDPAWGSQWAPVKISAPAAWDVTTGSANVTIAIVDSGIDYNDSDFSGRVTLGNNYVGGNQNPFDDNGHGTHVAGIAAAAGNNLFGIAGICWRCGILAIKVLDNTGNGFASDVASGIVDAANAGAAVVNLSLGGPDDASVDQAVTYAVSRGTVVVAAAGNDNGGPVSFPAASPGAMAVSATTSSDALASFSNVGPQISVAAPGAGIISMVPTGLCQLCDPSGLRSLSGTSMAAPHVSGLAALVKAQNPSFTPAQVRSTIESNADDLGPSGFDNSFGNGRINAVRALSVSGSVTNPGTVTLSAPANGATGVSSMPTLSWLAPTNAIAGTTQYTVTLKDSGGATLPALPATTTTSLSVPASEGLQAQATYSWSVVTCNDATHCSAPSASWTFTVAASVSTPGTVTLASPPNGASGQSRTPTLSWNAPVNSTSGTTQYTVKITGLPDLSPTTALSTIVPASEALISGQTYQWSVVACNDAAHCSSPGPSWSFTVAAGGGGAAAVITSPPPGSTITGTSATFTWSAATGALDYHLTVGRTPGGTEIADIDAGTALSATVSGLPANNSTIYVSLATLTGTFTTLTNSYTYTSTPAGGVTTPGTVTLSSPANGATGVSTTPALSWNAPANAIAGTTQYTVKMETGAGASLPDLPATTALSTTVPASEGLSAGQSYQWAVVACNDATRCSSPGTFWTFTVASGGVTTPGTVTLSSPGNGATVPNVTPTLSWLAPTNATSGTTQYTVKITGRADLPATTALSTVVPASEGLVAGQTYQWSVVACNDATHCSSPGPSWSFTVAGGGGPLGVITSPPPGSTIAGGTATFVWSAGSTATGYYLTVGTTPGGGEIAAVATGTALSATVSGLPANGGTIYVTLYSITSGFSWPSNSYTYISGP